ncbi:MAG TPA: DUF58 domain-containing protein [Oleiagrimonas sp.]|nr:DUF58 domain-containing protein [Oleiagrimonas sp.]
MNDDVPATSSVRAGRVTLPQRVWRWLTFLNRGKRPEPLPIVLGRKRIFILPTGFGVGFAVILLVMLVGALNYSNNAALLLTSLLGAVAAGSMLTTFRSMDGLRLDNVRAGTARAGEPIRLDMDFAVATRPRQALHLDIAGQTLAFDIPNHHRHTLELYLPTTRRGWMPLPRLCVHSTWPFGMFRAWSWLHPNLRLLIYPYPEAGGPPPPGDTAGQHRRHRHGGDDPASLRTYRPGDPIKLIAWKASARHENLLVREFEHPASRHDRVLTWNDTASLNHESRIARLARWIDEAHAANARWTLQLPDRTLGPDASIEHYHQCLRALALLP